MTKKKIKKTKNKKNKSNKIWWIAGVIVAVLLIGIFVFDVQNYFIKDSFSVNALLLKLNIPNGGQSLEKIKIINSVGERDFNLHLENLDDIASLDKKEFTLGSEEEKEVTISFNDFKFEANIYIGKLIVESLLSKKEIPIIVSVEDSNPYFAIIQNPIPNYLNVYPGGKIGIEVKFSNLRDFDLHDINVDYFVKNLDGETIISDEDSIAVKDSLSITKIIDVPKNIKSGNYVFITLMHDGTKSSASYFFEIKKKSFAVDVGEFNNYLVLLILVVIVGMLAYFFYFIKTRTELFQLNKLQRKELERNLALIKKYENELSKVKNRAERERKLLELKKKKKKVVNDIKEKHKLQKEEIKKLKKIGKKDLIDAKLKLWEKQGYEMSELRQGMKISKKEMSGQISVWKRQGYNVDMFE